MRLPFLVIFLFLATGSFADNLIPNPGFESFKRCPKGLGQINLADAWSSPNKGTPDYFNKCYQKDFQTVGIPNNFFSVQPVNEGNAYAGIYAGEQETEYPQVQLNDTLEAGKRYCLRFYASPPSEKGVELSSIGVWFRDAPHRQGDWNEIDDADAAIFPKFEMAREMIGWTLMSISYEAKGGETHLIVGYFGERQGRGYTYLDDFGLYPFESEEGCHNPNFVIRPLRERLEAQGLPTEVIAALDTLNPDNFVPNSGFEIKLDCPRRRENMEACYGWRVMENTPDFYHRCAKGSAGVPKNELGKQEPHSGEAYGGFWCYLPKYGDYREFISMYLKKPLTKGEVYCLSMWVSLSDRSKYALTDMQMMPSRKVEHIPSLIKVSDPRLVFLTDQDQPLSDRDGWTKVSALFVANGGETMLTIGNFRKNDDEQIVNIKNEEKQDGRFGVSSYYYVDDIILCDINAPIAECPDHLSPQIIADPDLPLIEVEEEIEVEIATIDTIPTVEWEAGDTLVLENFLFAYNAADLAPEALPMLDTLAAYLKRNPTLNLEIAGHTDSKGSEDYNLKLSLERAETVRFYLEMKGVETPRMVSEGKGEGMPLVPNDTEENRARNRRVEVMFLE